MKKNVEFGAFCEVYGKTLRNRFLEYLLEMCELDFAIGDLAKEIGISRPKAYEILKGLENECYVKKTRIVSGTQLYSLNKGDKKVKLLLKNFKECLLVVVDKYRKDTPTKTQDKFIEANVFVNDECINEKLAEGGR